MAFARQPKLLVKAEIDVEVAVAAPNVPAGITVKVTASLGDQRMSVQTNSQGDWAISIKAIKGDTLRIIFDSIYDGKTIGTKTWKVE